RRRTHARPRSGHPPAHRRPPRTQTTSPDVTRVAPPGARVARSGARVAAPGARVAVSGPRVADSGPAWRLLAQHPGDPQPPDPFFFGFFAGLGWKSDGAKVNTV